MHSEGTKTEYKTRGKEADSIVLPYNFPTIAQLPKWKTHMVGAVCQAANLVDDALVRKWVVEAMKEGATFKKMSKCPPEFARLDRKLGIALDKIITGDLSRRIEVEETKLLNTDGANLLRGRQKLWMMLESFRTNVNMARCYTIHDLCSANARGDAQLESLRIDWEDRVANRAERQSDEQLATPV